MHHWTPVPGFVVKDFVDGAQQGPDERERGPGVPGQGQVSAAKSQVPSWGWIPCHLPDRGCGDLMRVIQYKWVEAGLLAGWMRGRRSGHLGCLECECHFLRSKFGDDQW